MSESVLPTKCPICKRPVAVPRSAGGSASVENSSYPFCTERCKLVDLGRWLSDGYQIPVKEQDDDEERENPAL